MSETNLDPYVPAEHIALAGHVLYRLSQPSPRSRNLAAVATGLFLATNERHRRKPAGLLRCQVDLTAQARVEQRGIVGALGHLGILLVDDLLQLQAEVLGNPGLFDC